MLAGSKEPFNSSQNTEEDEESEAESEDTEGGGAFGMQDMATELAACEEQMSQFMRLNLLFSQISTPHFGAFVRND